jgi:hypothetical protein
LSAAVAVGFDLAVWFCFAVVFNFAVVFDFAVVCDFAVGGSICSYFNLAVASSSDTWF